MKPRRWLLPVLAAVLLALPGDREVDAAIPLLQAYVIGPWVICTGECVQGYCCQLVSAPTIDRQ